MSADEVEIVPYQNGPYLVRGPVKLRDQDGRGIEPGRRTIALCRCGKSRTRPFCDGTHQLIRFKVPSEPEEDRSTRADGGQVQSKPPALRRSANSNGSFDERLPEPAVRAGDDRPSGDQTAHAQSLIRAAIAALGQGTSESREIPKVIEQLAATVTLLEDLV